MDDHTIRLLRECNSGCKMAVNSMSQVEEYVTGEKLRRLLRTCIDDHREMEDETLRQLIQLNAEQKTPDKMAAAFSWLSTEMKMMMKDDDKQAAKILTDGCSMGIQTLCGFINQYQGASKESMTLAEKLVKTEEKFRDDLKPFL